MKLRLFCGPNGSGKSSLYEEFKKHNYSSGVYINSDEIEKEILKTGFLDLDTFNLKVSQNDFNDFLKEDDSVTLLSKAEESNHSIDISLEENIIVDKSKDTHSYEASLISSFIRKELIENENTFSFESVMSHSSKLNELKLARERGYRIYLYFVCIDDPEINVSRVENRVAKGGHKVDKEKVISRYKSTLENVFDAIQLADRVYLFDNSNTMRMIAEVDNKVMTLHVDQENMPNWFVEYIINKIKS
ncbi:zeta toxin family protein [Epilithonimonas hispanica]|nr:zeta toxin family protein [Epilithonimonas hispanica]